jgi:hypothetical protein
VLLGLSSTAFAQNSCGVASTPVSRDTNTGLTEVAGDLIFNCTFGGTVTTTATMTVAYGVTITNNTVYPAGKPIALTNVSGSFAAANCAPTISSVNNAGGQIIVNLPAMGGGGAGAGSCAAPPGGTTGSYTLTGALIALNGTGLTTLNSNISVSPGNNVLITAGQNVATVVTTILPGILDPKLTAGVPAGVVLTSGIAITPGFSINITENYIDMFRSAAQFDSGFGTNDTQLLLTFTGIPTGVTLGGCAVASSTGVAALSAAALTAAANTLTVTWPTGPSLTAADTVTVSCGTFTAGATATIPLTPGSITMQATLAPTGAALGAGNAVLVAATTGQIPRYASTLQPATPLAVLNIIPSQTNPHPVRNVVA